MQGGPVGPDGVNSVVTVEAVAVHHRHQHRGWFRRDGLFVLGVAGGQAPRSAAWVAARVGPAPRRARREPSRPGRRRAPGPWRPGPVRRRARPSRAWRSSRWRASDAGDVLVQRRLAHPEAGGESRQGELVQPHLVGQLRRLGDYPVGVQPSPRHGQPPEEGEYECGEHVGTARADSARLLIIATAPSPAGIAATIPSASARGSAQSGSSVPMMAEDQAGDAGQRGAGDVFRVLRNSAIRPGSDSLARSAAM